MPGDYSGRLPITECVPNQFSFPEFIQMPKYYDGRLNLLARCLCHSFPIFSPHGPLTRLELLSTIEQS
jgi:hypothetical protein